MGGELRSQVAQLQVENEVSLTQMSAQLEKANEEMRAAKSAAAAKAALQASEMQDLQRRLHSADVEMQRAAAASGQRIKVRPAQAVQLRFI